MRRSPKESAESFRKISRRGVILSGAQLALAWCLRKSNVSSVIVGATRVSQIEDNAKAAGVKLPQEIVARLDALTTQAR